MALPFTPKTDFKNPFQNKEFEHTSSPENNFQKATRL